MSGVGSSWKTRVVWVGFVLTVGFLVVDGVLHIANPDVVRKAMVELGFRSGVTRTIGVIDLCCVALLVIRRTAPLGAVLLTGYLRGAIAVNLRADKPLFSTTLFPIYVALFVWGGVFVRRDDVLKICRSMVKGTSK